MAFGQLHFHQRVLVSLTPEGNPSQAARDTAKACDPDSNTGRSVLRRHRQTFTLAIIEGAMFRDILQRLCMLLIVASLSGCASYEERIRSTRGLFYANDLPAAMERLKEERQRDAKSRDAISLDLATAQLMSGKPHAAEQTFRGVRDRFDYLEQADLTEGIRAFATDDTARAYAGADYEKLLLRAMLTISNLMGDGDDALAYSHQFNAKQEQIISAGVPGAPQNPKKSYQRVALGAYLHGVLREANHLDYDEAARSFARVASWQPTFTSATTDLERARGGRHSAAGHGVLYVFALVGRGPRKIEVEEIPTSTALLIADRILSATGEYTLPPTLAPIKIPVIAVPRNAIAGVSVQVAGQGSGKTQTITDIGKIAVQQHQTMLPHIMARAVARRVVKKAAVYAVKDSLDVAPAASLLLDIAGVAWEAVESADTRCWGLLPNQIQVLRLEVPAGRHRVELQPTGKSRRPIGLAHRADVVIEDGRTTFALACFPDRHRVGEILVSNAY